MMCLFEFFKFSFLKLVYLLSLLGCCCFFQCNTLNRELKTIHDYDYAAKFYYDLEDYKKAIKYYQQIVDKFSPQKTKYQKELAWAKYEIAFCYLLLEDYQKALKKFKKILYQHDILAVKILTQQRIREIEEKIENTNQKK